MKNGLEEDDIKEYFTNIDLEHEISIRGALFIRLTYVQKIQCTQMTRNTNMKSGFLYCLRHVVDDLTQVQIIALLSQ